MPNQPKASRACVIPLTPLLPSLGFFVSPSWGSWCCGRFAIAHSQTSCWLIFWVRPFDCVAFSFWLILYVKIWPKTGDTKRNNRKFSWWFPKSANFLAPQDCMGWGSQFGSYGFPTWGSSVKKKSKDIFWAPGATQKDNQRYDPENRPPRDLLTPSP